MAAPQLVIGLDLATASARAVAVELGSPATVIAHAKTELPAPRTVSPGRIEQDSEYGSATDRVLSQLSELLTPEQRNSVRAISVTGTSGTALALDAKGLPLGPALLYSDTRGQGLLAQVEASEVGRRPTATLGRLSWLAKHYSGALLATSADAALAFLAGGPLGMSDTSHWVKAGISLEDASWPTRSLENLGIDQSLVPSLSRPGVPAGALDQTKAKRWGFPTDVALVLGMTDGCTSQIATGAVLLGDSVGVLGTTFVLKAVSATSVDIPSMGVYSHEGPDGAFWPGGASNTGAGAMPQEFSRLNPSELEEWGTVAVAHGPASHVRYGLPGRGERFPFVSCDVESFATGQPNNSTDLYRSFLEGVAFAERYGREILGRAGVVLGRHVVSGGASKSPSWTRIRATVLGQSIVRASFGDSAIGAAFLAGFPLQTRAWSEYLADLVPPPDVVDPLEEEIFALEQRYQEFLQELDSRGLK